MVIGGMVLRRDIGSRDASLANPAEEDIADSPVHVLERVGFPRNRHYTQVCGVITLGRPLYSFSQYEEMALDCRPGPPP